MTGKESLEKAIQSARVSFAAARALVDDLEGQMYARYELPEMRANIGKTFCGENGYNADERWEYFIRIVDVEENYYVVEVLEKDSRDHISYRPHEHYHKNQMFGGDFEEVVPERFDEVRNQLAEDIRLGNDVPDPRPPETPAVFTPTKRKSRSKK